MGVIGKVYQIYVEGLYETYIGSTFKKLETRLKEHKEGLNCSSKELFDRGVPQIKLLEEYKGIGKKDLLKKEAEYQRKTPDIVNYKLAYRGDKYEQVDCLCGSRICVDQKARHERTYKCLFARAMYEFIYS